jgi:hypothetical protein
MESYDTLSEAITALRAQGYTEDFNLQQNYLVCRNGEYSLSPDEFHIEKTFRFEGATNPDDESILYAISSSKHDLKGVLVNAYGIYSEPLMDEMVKKLKFD